MSKSDNVKTDSEGRSTPVSEIESIKEIAYQFKIVLIGDSGVGKTSIMNRFANEKFSLELKSTIGVEFSKRNLSVDSDEIQVLIWDTAGQERFRALARTYYRGAVGALVVFDVSKPHTLENVSKTWVKEIRENASEHIKILLVGNKVDLEFSEQRLVTSNQALEIAKEHELAYIETSALNATNIDEAFYQIVRNIKYDMQNFSTEIRPKNMTVKIPRPSQMLIPNSIGTIEQDENSATKDQKKLKKKSSCC